MAALGRGPKTGEEQTDIFAPEQQGQQGQPGTSRIQASNTSGDLGPNRSASGAPGGSAPVVQGSSTAAKNELINRNKGRVGAPVDAGKMATDISGAKDNLQKEADAYVQGADDRYEQDDSASVNYYANSPAGDESGFLGGSEGSEVGYKPDKKASKDWLDLYSAGQAGQVDAIDLKTDTSFRDADLLANDAGLRELFRRSGDAEYNAGEAAFDATLLGKDTGFNQSREQVLRNKRDLGKTENDILQNAQSQAQEAANAGYQNWRGGVDDQLLSAIDGYRNKALEAESAFDTDLGGYDDAAAAKFFKEENKRRAALGQLSDTIGMDDFAPDELARYLTNNVSAETTGWQDFLGQNEAGNFSKIMQLMGRGGDSLPGTGKYAGKKAADFAKYDSKRMYEDKSNQLRKERTEREKKASDEMAAARAAAEAAKGGKKSTGAAKGAKDGMSGGKNVKEKLENELEKPVKKVTSAAGKANPFRGRW
jgi:hypothetical protein